MKLKEILQLLKEHDIKAKRSLGQNFLTDERVVRSMKDVAKINAQDLVIEIGPGLGILTKELLTAAGKVIAIEIDQRFHPILATIEPISKQQFDLILADVRSINLTELCQSWQGPIKIVANLPYYITSELILKVLIELSEAICICVMLQKEVLSRYLALPGQKEYGPLAILIALYGEAKSVLNVSRASFYPKPHVDSVVLLIQKKQNLKQVAELSKWLQLIFSKRRKTLLNNLKASVDYSTEKQAKIILGLEHLKLSLDVRAESISPENIFYLFNLWHNETKIGE